jgi:hypothetical protein
MSDKYFVSWLVSLSGVSSSSLRLMMGVERPKRSDTLYVQIAETDDEGCTVAETIMSEDSDHPDLTFRVNPTRSCCAPPIPVWEPWIHQAKERRTPPFCIVLTTQQQHAPWTRALCNLLFGNDAVRVVVAASVDEVLPELHRAEMVCVGRSFSFVQHWAPYTGIPMALLDCKEPLRISWAMNCDTARDPDVYERDSVRIREEAEAVRATHAQQREANQLKQCARTILRVMRRHQEYIDATLPACDRPKKVSGDVLASW